PRTTMHRYILREYLKSCLRPVARAPSECPPPVDGSDVQPAPHRVEAEAVVGHEPVAQTSAGRSWSTGSDSVLDSVSDSVSDSGSLGRSGHSNTGRPFSSQSTTTGTSQAAWTSGIS